MNKLLLIAITGAAMILTTYIATNKSTITNKQTGFLKSSTSSVPTPIYDAWVHWKQRYGKSYGTDNEDSYRLGVFYDNFKYVNANQPADGMYRLGLNQFADMSPAEFKKTYLNTKKPETKKNYQSLKRADSGFEDYGPTKVDWIAQNAVTPIKNQGQCGSCWSFSAGGSTEGLGAIKTGELRSFSEQQQMDCSKDLGNQSCQGGYMDKALQYIAQKGIMLDKDYPYYAQDRNQCDYDATKVAFQPTGYVDVPQDDSDELRKAVAQVPVSVGVAAEQLQFYVDGIWHYDLCLTEPDHGVLIVGYDTDDITGMKYWKVKNSWGTAWGEDGYIRMKRVDGKGVGICGITKMAAYPTKN